MACNWSKVERHAYYQDARYHKLKDFIGRNYRQVSSNNPYGIGTFIGKEPLFHLICISILKNIYYLQVAVDFKKLHGDSTSQYGLLNGWDKYSDLVLEKAYKKTKDKQFDIAFMNKNEGKWIVKSY